MSHQAQVGEGILDLGPFEKAQTAIDAIGDIGAQQCLLQHAGLGVGAVEDGILGTCPPLGAPVLDLLGNKTGLVEIIEGGIELDRFAISILGPELLAHAPRVVLDQCVGSIEDVTAGAVVLLQPQGLNLGKVTGEAADVLHLRPTPAVNTLVIITQNKYRSLFTSQQADPRILDGVGILKLVHQNVAEAVAVVGQQLRIVEPHLVGPQQQLGEVDQSAALTGGLVGHIDIDHLGQPVVMAGFDLVGANPLVLLFIDKPGRLFRWPALLIEIHLLDQAAHQPQLVLAVEDLEVLGQVGLLPVAAQQAVGQSVEGPYP